VEQLFISELAHSSLQVVPLREADLHVHVYRLHEEGPSSGQHIDGIANGACRVLELPAKSLEGLWDSYVCPGRRKRCADGWGSLMFEPGLKIKLLGFVSSLGIAPPPVSSMR
jgi:hypothetical protein